MPVVPARRFSTALIDLHVHTTASDGVLAPDSLVLRAKSAGITALSVTDHDTTAGLAVAREAARCLDIRFVDGIEITAVEADRDVHVLGYFFDPDDDQLGAFLERQREDRVRRVHEIVARLAAAGWHIDAEPVLAAARQAGRSVGRPHIADALVAAGHARDRNDAFDRLVGSNGCAFVPRRGPSAVDVVALIRAAGGIASLAHPGLTRRDDLIPALAEAGLTALEARHADHDGEAEARYRRLALQHGLAVTGGSDFHADGDHHVGTIGQSGLSLEDFAALQERVPPKRRIGEGERL